MISLSQLSNGPINAQAPTQDFSKMSWDQAVQATPTQSSNQNYASQVGNNLANTFSQGGQNVMNDIGNTSNLAKQAGNSPLAKVAAVGATAGHVAGDIGATAGGILGSFITPLLPQGVKNGIGDVTKYVSDKVNSIPGMTPEIAKSLGDVFNTITLEGGSKISPTVENVANTAKGAAESAGTALENVGDSIKNPLSSLGSKTNEANAIATRNLAAQEGVKNLQNITESVGDYKNDLGASFKQGALNIEKTKPNLKLTLSPDQIESLNKLKENKSFALPDYLKPNHVPGDLKGIENSGKLTPTQAQDLITQLNKSTYTEKASGLAVDQTKIGLTNDIKNSASKAFGKDWDKLYSDYSKGRDAVEKLGNIVNIDKNATPADMNKSLNSILKLSSTPEGKIILQNSINEFKNTSGIDLTNPTQAISKILESDKEFQQAMKGGFFKQNKSYITRRLIIGGGMSLIGVYAAANAIRKALTGGK